MELYCKDCGAPIQYGGRGPHPKRCKECQKKHLAEVRKAYTKTPKGHAVMLEASRKYRKTPKGQKRAKKFNETYQPWYRESEHGKSVANLLSAPNLKRLLKNCYKGGLL